ncbi:hypothetical protein [Streptomyces yaizuensis]|uniref:Uncharacterized protein n=1 Tax=Streptomyces yaizuensis TaxID=2989713 RepID=A0AA86IVN6_9ACTN|nr:hypothetical protein [Streptomyces sp. YSPA8]BDT39570.1 hypothetical protein SYYSPA8_37260 [Streptomyces sp. YSPA8]
MSIATVYYRKFTYQNEIGMDQEAVLFHRDPDCGNKDPEAEWGVAAGLAGITALLLHESAQQDAFLNLTFCPCVGRQEL